MPKIKKNKYYAVYSKNDNFLHGVFPLTEEGFKKAKNYITKLSITKNNPYYIEKK